MNMSPSFLHAKTYVRRIRQLYNFIELVCFFAKWKGKNSIMNSYVIKYKIVLCLINLPLG